MKKFLSILMSLIMCFSLVACGSKEKYEMTGIYMNSKWYKTSDTTKGSIEFDNSDWTTGEIEVIIDGESIVFELSNKQIVDKGYISWSGKNKSNGANVSVLGSKQDDGSILVVVNQVGFKFEK